MKSIFFTCIYLFSISALTHAQIVHVPTDQTTIQAAIDAASEGDTVLVAEGTYYENINYKGKAITVASQFIEDGDTSHISKTIIDGSQPLHADTACVVRFISNEDTTSVLNGFTLTGGKGLRLNFSGTIFSAGGGVFINHGAKIINNIICKNEVGANNLTTSGAGISCSSDYGNVVIRNNIITGNKSSTSKSSRGGGMSLYGTGYYILVENNVISNNTSICSTGSASTGGGIICLSSNPQNNTLIVRNNKIMGNAVLGSYSFGGGLYLLIGEFSSPQNAVPNCEIYNNIITNNTSEWHTGGIGFNELNKAYLTLDTPVVKIFNNTMVNNSAVEGACISISAIKVLLANNILNGPVRTLDNASYIGRGNFVGDAEDALLDTETFELLELSPCIDNGFDSVQVGSGWLKAPLSDYYNRSRPDTISQKPDIGAVESKVPAVLPDDFKIGKHTVSEWHTMIDTTWEEVLTDSEKLDLFDKIWQAVDLFYAGFANLDLNWNLIRNHYRPEIETGVSRGRFAAILSKLSYNIREPHSGFGDLLFANYELSPDMPVMIYRYPRNMLLPGHTDDGWFGATVTPFDENTLIVLRCIPDHPLGLQPGDQIIGYDGIVWRDLYPFLIKLELPQCATSIGGTKDANTHRLLSSVGMNWHLFETIDIKKYGSNDTLHLSTSLLKTEKQNFFGVEMLPVNGINYPGNLSNSVTIGTLPNVFSGTVENTNIAYLYMIHTEGDDRANASKIKNALDAVIKENTEGLIIDMRIGKGGNFFWETGFNNIFNRTIDSCGFYARTLNGDHTDLEKVKTFSWRDTLFDELSEEFMNKPVALLMGPSIQSNGDYAAYFINSQPMTRSFGKGGMAGWTFNADSPNGIECLTDPELYNDRALKWNMGYTGFFTQFAGRNFGRTIDGNLKYFLHTYFDADEDIWFTQDAAYNHTDNMVVRAVDWIQSVAYAENCRLADDTIYTNHETPQFIQTNVVNPDDHTVELSAKVYTKEGIFVKDVNMQQNTTENISGLEAGEWYGQIDMEEEGDYYAEVSVKDIYEDSYLTYPGYLEFSVISTGIHDLSSCKGLSVYPNPVSSTINIEVLNKDLYNIKIIALNGQTILETEMHEKEKQIDVSDLKAGLYLIRICSEDMVITEKLIKQ